MSWFRQNSSQKPDYTGLQLQTSVTTLPIPILWGQTKAAANVHLVRQFPDPWTAAAARAASSARQRPAYTYTADLDHGALRRADLRHRNDLARPVDLHAGRPSALTFFDGSTPQTAWGYLASAIIPTEALAYQGTAYVCAASYALGDNADIGNHNFEIVGMLAGTGVNGIDADPAQVIQDFPDQSAIRRGIRLRRSIDATTLLGSSGDASSADLLQGDGHRLLARA